MGAAPSKINEDKALGLCQERKRFVREALDGRCNLAVTHFSYIESLRNTDIALRKFPNPGYRTEPFPFAASTLVTPNPIQKAMSHISSSAALSNRHVEVTGSFSPSPISSGRFHVNHMKAASAGFAKLVSYTVQWLVVTSHISLPYIAVSLLCLLGGCTICRFNAVCLGHNRN